jgi:hypothetical protein
MPGNTITGSRKTRIEEDVKFPYKAVRNVGGAANAVSGPPNPVFPESRPFFPAHSLNHFPQLSTFRIFCS